MEWVLLLELLATGVGIITYMHTLERVLLYTRVGVDIHWSGCYHTQESAGMGVIIYQSGRYHNGVGIIIHLNGCYTRE